MNINEHMNQLGQIGSVGYSATDTVVDDLVGRTRRARGARQMTAAIAGSVGAIALGVVGAQIFVGLSQQDAGMRDRAYTTDFAFLDMTWEQRYGEGYTGLDKTPAELNNAWEDLQAQAAVSTEDVKPVESTPTCSYETKTVDGWVKVKSPDTGCEWKKDHYVGNPDVPAGSIEFAGIIAPCKTYTDSATGGTIFAAYVDSGSWRKIVACEGGEDGNYWAGEYRYIFKDGSVRANVSGTTCTGVTISAWGAPHQYSCLPFSALANRVGEWPDANGHNARWTLNNEDGLVRTSAAVSAYRWFESGTCGPTYYEAANTVGSFHSCYTYSCNGWFYLTSDHPTKNGHRYSWSSGQNKWIVDDPVEPTPTPTPTETTPPPEPSPEPEPSVTA